MIEYKQAQRFMTVLGVTSLAMTRAMVTLAGKFKRYGEEQFLKNRSSKTKETPRQKTSNKSLDFTIQNSQDNFLNHIKPQNTIPIYKPSESLTDYIKPQNTIPIYKPPESPATAIAREKPLDFARILDRDNERKRYNEGLAIGSKLVGDYLKELSREEHSKVRKIEIFPEQQFKVMGLSFGRKAMEVKIKR